MGQRRPPKKARCLPGSTTATRRWKPFVEDGMLCVDLTQAGIVIQGNRAKKNYPGPTEVEDDTGAS